MGKFDENWAKPQKDSFGKNVRETVKGPQPLKPQIQKATSQLNQEIHRLDGTMSRLKQREEKIFKKTVHSVQVHDQETSKAYSNELAEIRKMAKLVTQSKIALEQINVRLQTVTDMGDFAATMSPAIGVVKSLRNTLGQAMPEAQDALGELGTSLNSMMLDVGQFSGGNFYFGEPDEEANKILAEASAIAEKRISEQFPDIPGTSPESTFTTG